jgi:hypothetical protein
MEVDILRSELLLRFYAGFCIVADGETKKGRSFNLDTPQFGSRKESKRMRGVFFG